MAERVVIPGGLLIAVEGIDGAGKTTLANALAEALRESRIPVVTSKEPTNGPFGRKLRESAATGRLNPLVEMELLARDRAEHVSQLIAPSLENGEAVVLDRYYLSSVAYQGAAGISRDQIINRNESFAPKPDVTLILDLPVDVALGRIAVRGDTPNDFERKDTLEACRRIFADLAQTFSGAVAIDATAPPEAVLDAALAAVLRAIGEKYRGAFGMTRECIEKLSAIRLSAAV